jgi:hypothetical protein
MRGKLSNGILSGDQTPDEELRRQQIEHRLRSKAKLQITEDDVARMVAAFATSNGGVTKCAPAYAALSPQYRL